MFRIEFNGLNCYIVAVGNVEEEGSMKKIMVLGSLLMILSVGMPAFAQVVKTYDVTIP